MYVTYSGFFFILSLYYVIFLDIDVYISKNHKKKIML